MRTLMAVIAGAVVVFVYNAVSWLALPFHGESLHDFPGAPARSESFLDAFPDSGVFHFPGHSTDTEEMKARAERSKRGPVVTMMVLRKEGLDPMAPGNYVKTFLLDLAAAGIAVLVLRGTRSGFAGRVAVVSLLGAFVAVVARAQDWVWWAQPAEYALPGVVDAVVCWLLAGVVLARLTPPPPR